MPRHNGSAGVGEGARRSAVARTKKRGSAHKSHQFGQLGRAKRKRTPQGRGGIHVTFMRPE